MRGDQAADAIVFPVTCFVNRFRLAADESRQQTIMLRQ
jgi:hypothetical protein